MEGHLLCNGVSNALSASFMASWKPTHTHRNFKEENLGTTWRDIFLPWSYGGKVTDGMERNGSQIKRQYGPREEEGPKEGRQRDRTKKTQTGNGSHVWQVKLAETQQSGLICGQLCVCLWWVWCCEAEGKQVQLDLSCAWATATLNATHGILFNVCIMRRGENSQMTEFATGLNTCWRLMLCIQPHHTYMWLVVTWGKVKAVHAMTSETWTKTPFACYS